MTPRAPQKPPFQPPALTDAILESISDGVFTVGPDWRVTSFNRAAEQITGIPRREAIGRPCSEVFRSSMCETDCALRRTMETGQPVVQRTCYIVDAHGERIPISVSTAVLTDENGTAAGGAETFRDLREVEALRKELQGAAAVGGLVSRSPAMHRVFELVALAGPSEATVLIQGETGSGKELAARALHEASRRSGEPFAALNCGALPDTLLESELFGYKKGAFTGADRDKPGRFALAGRGTLFLDEIGDVSPAMQVRLLRVLQERMFTPLGGRNAEPVRARIVAATNRDLQARVAEGAFREDLFYRINVVRIEMPPLRRRKEDVPLLVETFIERFNRIQGKRIERATPEALALLMAYDWPGNVRELENVVERAFVVCEGLEIDARCLPAELTGGLRRNPIRGPMESARRSAEEHAIRITLDRNKGNRTATARDLGIHKTTLYRKMQAMGIAAPERDGRSRGD